MLHLKVPIRSGTSYGEIEYENPLQKSRQDYYSVKLHSIYSDAAETERVNVPLSFTIQDSAYVASIDNDEIDTNLSIKDYSRKLANLLSGNTQNSRASRSFVNTLKNYSPNVPSASFTDSADDDVSSRYFNLVLPKRTFLFSNLLAPLHALGYADDQIEYIPNLYEYPEIAREVIDNSSVPGVYANISSIYVVTDNTTNSLLPTPSNEGRIKWLDEDTFESVYFPGRRRERYIETADIPRQRIRVRTRRNTILDIVLSQDEENAEIKVGDTKDVKLGKLAKLQKWETRAIQTKIEKSGRGKPFNPSELEPQGEETPEIAKRNYWREKLVEAVTDSTSATAMPEIIVPIQYFSVDVDAFLEPIKTLGDLDPKSYVQIAANASLLSFYSTYLSMIEKQLQSNPSLSQAVKVSLRRAKTKYTEEQTNRFRIQAEAIKNFRQARQSKKKLVENEAGTKPVAENGQNSISSGQGISAVGAPGGSDHVDEVVSSNEEKTETEDERCNERDIDCIVEKLQELMLKAADQKSIASEHETTASEQTKITITNLTESITLFNTFLTDAQASASPPTIKIVDDYVTQVEEAEQLAIGARDSIISKRENIQSMVEEKIKKKALSYVEFVKAVIDNPDVEAAIKQKAQENMLIINEHKNSIKTSIEDLNTSLQRVQSFEKESNENCTRIGEIVLSLNTIYNLVNMGQTVVYPQPIVDDRYNVDEGGVSPPKRPKTVTTTSTTTTTTVVTPSTPTTITTPAAGPDTNSGGNGGHVEDEIEEYDQRNDDNYRARTKYSIGFIHFKDEPFIVDSTVTIGKMTTPADITAAIIRRLGQPLLTNNTLNMAFKPTFVVDPNNPSKRFAIKNERELPYNTSYLQINLKNRRYANLMRLSTLSNGNHMITLYANSQYTKFSDHFDILDPFQNDFTDHLPLILSPSNAGPFNSFSSVAGEMTTMGIVESRGRVKNAVEILMRSSERERYMIHFYNGHNLEKKIFPRDYVLYFHFNIDVVD